MEAEPSAAATSSDAAMAMETDPMATDPAATADDDDPASSSAPTPRMMALLSAANSRDDSKRAPKKCSECGAQTARERCRGCKESLCSACSLRCGGCGRTFCTLHCAGHEVEIPTIEEQRLQLIPAAVQALDSTAGRSDIRCKRCVRRQRREERFQTPGKGSPVPQSGFETPEGHVALMVTE